MDTKCLLCSREVRALRWTQTLVVPYGCMITVLVSGSQSWERDRLGAQPGLALQGLHLSSAASGPADEILHLNAPVLSFPFAPIWLQK